MTVIAFTKPTVDNELPSFGVLTEYVQANGELVHPGLRDVARITHDGRFALLKNSTRGYYQLAVLIGDVASHKETSPKIDGYAADDTPVFRHVAHYSGKISLVEEQAGELVGSLAGRDPFTVELPGAEAHRVDQLVQLRARIRENRDSSKLGHYSWTEDGRAYDQALRVLVSDNNLTERDRMILTAVVTGRARTLVEGKASYTETGFYLDYVGPVPSIDEQVELAHAEAIREVLQTRINQTESTLILRAQRVELEAELRAATERELEAARERLAQAERTAKLALHSVDDAAQQLLNRGHSLSFASRKSAYGVAEELLRIDQELEIVKNAPVPNTVLLGTPSEPVDGLIVV